MKKIELLILFSLISFSICIAQDAKDGISLRKLDTNRESFYHGEPVSFAFELKNNTPIEKKYWKMSTGVNVFYKLIDLKSNKEIGNSISDWTAFASIRENFRNTPYEGHYFQPNEAYFFVIDLAADLSSDYFQKYTKGLKYRNTLSRNLVTLPIGNYKLIIEFYLMPSENKIQVQHEFAIQKLPSSEIEAYENFLESTVYAANSYYAGDNNYMPSADRSYETFMDNYPESLFSEYAFFNLINKVYHYGGTNTISNEDRRQKKEEFISNKDFKLKNLIAKKAYIFPQVLNGVKNIDKHKALEKQLMKLEEEDPILSDQISVKAKKDLK